MNITKLMTRDEFRSSVFERDNHLCVFCKNPAQDAHHVMERRLWPDGGYYLENGVSVCGSCHLLCESTDISVEDCRVAAGINKPNIPPHLYDDLIYDKWGNIVLDSIRRTKGELYEDESVRKILGQRKSAIQFVDCIKYPRTYHLPWSENITDDDRVMPSTDCFLGKEVVVTEKMDGENTSMYRDRIHARSIDSPNHASRNWVKNFWSQVCWQIPEGWRICGENLFAKHSIFYGELPSYFMGFSVWTGRNECLSWDETELYLQVLGIEVVPVIYRGEFSKEKIVEAAGNHKLGTEKEGYVVRIANQFSYKDFRSSVGKYVRKNHCQTVNHWMYGKAIEKNLMKETLSA